MSARRTAAAICFALMLLGGAAVSATASRGSTPQPPVAAGAGILTGAHWGTVSDLPTFRKIGYGFDVTTCQPENLASCTAALSSAKRNGLRLIIGGYPEPYALSSDGTWTISPAGVAMLRLFAAHASTVIAVFVFNEPYWVSGYSADQLRALRLKIRSVWSAAKVYQDVGQPSGWGLGGPFSKGSDKWAHQRGVCDYCGVWDYPFGTGGYDKVGALAVLRRETRFVRSAIGGVPVWLNQAHAASCCDLVYPTAAEIKDWNCATRSALPKGALISWYVWRQNIYPSYLANHRDEWPLTVASACRRSSGH
jgi:hypothetical protein